MSSDPTAPSSAAAIDEPGHEAVASNEEVPG